MSTLIVLPQQLGHVTFRSLRMPRFASMLLVLARMWAMSAKRWAITNFHALARARRIWIVTVPVRGQMLAAEATLSDLARFAELSGRLTLGEQQTMGLALQNMQAT